MQILNKSFMTNLLSVGLIGLGYVMPGYQELLLSCGYFALSGAITNWLAVYMLFEKVPFLYGSGVIPNNFAKFKVSIKELIMEQFFSLENIDRFIGEEFAGGMQGLADKINYSLLFDELVDNFMQSSLGAVLNMFGGKAALEGMRDELTAKLREVVASVLVSREILQDEAANLTVASEKVTEVDELHFSSGQNQKIQDKVELIIDERLKELTPKWLKKWCKKLLKNI